MERDKIIEYLCSDCLNVKEIKRMLEQFKDRNDNLMVELLMHFKSDNLNQIDRILDDEHQLRTMITDILIEVSSRDQFFYQLCRYISIWNIFNKILEVEDEKKRIREEIQTIITRAPIARKILTYLHDNPRESCEDISKGVRYSQDSVSNILDALCDKDVVYKILIGDNSIYDLTEYGRLWANKNISGTKADVMYVKKNLYEDMRQKYQAVNNTSVKYIQLDIMENRFKFGRNIKLQSIFNGGKEIDQIERKEMAGMFDYIVRY